MDLVAYVKKRVPEKLADLKKELRKQLKEDSEREPQDRLKSKDRKELEEILKGSQTPICFPDDLDLMERFPLARKSGAQEKR